MAYDNYKLGLEALCAKTEQGSTPRANERLVARVPGMNTVGENSPHSGTAERGWWDDTCARGKICRQNEEKGRNCARCKMGTGEMLVKASYRPIHGNSVGGQCRAGDLAEEVEGRRKERRYNVIQHL